MIPPPYPSDRTSNTPRYRHALPEVTVLAGPNSQRSNGHASRGLRRGPMTPAVIWGGRRGVASLRRQAVWIVSSGKPGRSSMRFSWRRSAN